MSYDVAIVGGGVLGSATALRLAQRGARVVVLEKAIPGAEASSASGGLLLAQVDAVADGPLVRLSLRSRAAWAPFAAEVERLSEQRLGHARCGALVLAFDDAALHALRERYAWQRAAGQACDVLMGDEARRLEPALGGAVVGAVRLPDEEQVDAQAIAQALPAAATSAGVHFRRGLVRRVALEDGRAVGLELDDGHLAARSVLLAAGAWTTMVEGTGLPTDVIRPVRGQLCKLALRTPPVRHLLLYAGGFVVPRSNGELLCGATVEHVGFDRRVTAGGVSSLLPLALRAVPALADAELVTCWAGFRPSSRDGLPLLGESPTPGLFLASGHGGSGLLLAPESARLVAAAMRNEHPPELHPFSPRRFVGRSGQL